MNNITSKLSDLDVAMINDLIVTTQSLQQCSTLIAEWKEANDAQINRLDQIARAADVVAGSAVILQNIAEKLTSNREHSPNQSNNNRLASAEAASFPNSITPPVKIKQEVGVIDPLSSLTSKLDKELVLRLNRIHPMKIAEAKSAITISSDVQNTASGYNDDDLRSKKLRSLSALGKVRNSLSQIGVPIRENVKTMGRNSGNAAKVGAKKSTPSSLNPGPRKVPRRVTRSKSVLDDAKMLLDSLADK